MEEQLIGQMNIFDCFGTPYVIDKPIKLIEIFAGIGSQAMSLRDIGASFEHHRMYEIDKYACASYNAIHHTNFEPTDITKVKGADLGIDDKLNYTYLVTYSFPCVDLSVAGAMKGYAEGSGTRSSLLWEVKRLLEECEELPQVLVLENVTQIHNKNNGNMEHFQKWIDYLASKGYSSFWKDMNAKDYGCPQSRNRTFMVSILGDYTYKFPDQRPLDKCMKDYLQDEVDENYYITNESAWNLVDELVKKNKIDPSYDKYGTTHYPHGWLDADCSFAGISPTLDAGLWKHHTMLIEKREVVRLGNLDENSNQRYVVYDSNSISHCLQQTMGTGGGQAPYTTECRVVGGFGEKTSNGGTQYFQQRRVYSIGDICNCLSAQIPTGSYNYLEVKTPKSKNEWIWNINGIDFEIRIRKITPREAWRLMFFTDEDFEKAQEVNSNTQLYKQAGNSICKNCLCLIFQNLLGAEYD